MTNDGFLLINKASGMSSFDVVRKVKKDLNEKSAGHSGTLDPLADGLMIIALGHATGLLKYYIGLDKEYEVLACFGSKSDTYDAEGQITKISEVAVDEATVRDCIMRNFIGEISQMPPKYSALKIGGKRACDIMREGGDVDLKPRNLTIYSFEILEFNFPFVRFLISCSSGTYVRSLVNDLGEKLKVGAYVKTLRRNKIGPYSLSDASNAVIPIDEFVKKMPKVELNDAQSVSLKDGKKLIDDSLSVSGVGVFAFFKGKFAGVLEKNEDGSIKMKKSLMK